MVSKIRPVHYAKNEWLGRPDPGIKRTHSNRNNFAVITVRVSALCTQDSTAHGYVHGEDD